MALKLLPEDLSDVPTHLAERYEAQAGRYWDIFYRRNTTKFFKDRHYLHKEFPDLAAGAATLLEVGCGVGNTVFPLLEINPALKIYCCDFAPSAIELVRKNPLYGASGGTVHAFVADITSDLLAGSESEGGCSVPEGGCDMATMIFVLSAVHPQRMAAAVHNVARCLRPGSGRLLFRDYAEGDLAQERLAGGDRPKRLGPNFYVRGDGTRCYYFSQPEVLSLFAAAGFVCDSVTLHERTVVNHKRDIAMDRRWLQAIFTLQNYQPPTIPLKTLLAQSVILHLQAQTSQQQQQQQLPLLAMNGSGCCSADPGCGHSAGGPAAEERREGDGGGNGIEGCSTMDIDVDAGNVAATTVGTGAAETTAGGMSSVGAGAGVSSGLYSGSWLTGAAGRLASHLAAGPGHPSGRALLPETLDSAEDLRAELSPLHLKRQHHHDGHGYDHDHRNRLQPSPPQPPTQLPGAHGAGSGAVSLGGGGAEGDGGGCMQVDGMPLCASNAGLQNEDERRRQRGSNSGGSSEAEGGVSLETALEAEFFATIGRDSAEVVAEEVAATGAALSRVRLVDVAEVAAARLTAAAAAAAATAAATAPMTTPDVPPPPRAASVHPPDPPPARPPSEGLLQDLAQEVDVPVGAGVSFRCLVGGLAPNPLAGIPTSSLALARIFLASPHLLAGKCALQLGPARLPSVVAAAAATAKALPSVSDPWVSPTCPSAVAPPVSKYPNYCNATAAVLPAMAAVRGSARRVVVSEAGRQGLAAAAADLRRNAHLVVIERLRLMALDWAAASANADATSSAAAAVGVSAGYVYVEGAVRQIRDVLQIQSTGYDLIYAADPLSAVTDAVSAAAAAASSRVRQGGEGSSEQVTGETAIAAARALFHLAGRLIAGGCGSLAGVAAGRGHLSYRADEKRQGLLLLCVPGEWAALHGVGFAALAAVCGWELLVPEQLVEEYGADVAMAASLGCAALAFRRRLAASAASS